MQTITKPSLELDNNKPMFPISVVADSLQVHQRTLRIWEAEGIFIPGRSPKNRRLYSMNDLERGRLILRLLRDVGLNLAGIKLIFCLSPHPEQLEGAMNYVASTEKQAENREKLSKRGRKKGS